MPAFVSGIPIRMHSPFVRSRSWTTAAIALKPLLSAAFHRAMIMSAPRRAPLVAGAGNHAGPLQEQTRPKR